MKSTKIKNTTLFSFFLAIELILLFTPLGFLRIGPLSATLMHIPVIIISIIMGTKYGTFLGLIFGISSIAVATFSPDITAFCFSPFVTVGNISGNWSSLIVAIVPRLLIGICTATTFKLVHKKMNITFSTIIAALIGSLVNTLLVLALIYTLFGKSYAVAINVPYSTLIHVLLTIIFTNGIFEAIIASIITTAVVKGSQKIIK